HKDVEVVDLPIQKLFLQKPANPDLLYIIFFCHTQLTVTLLLCLIFGSKVFVVFNNKGRNEDGSSMVSKTPSSKFISKGRPDNKPYSTNSSGQDFLYSKYNEHDVQEEFSRVYTQLEILRERNMRVGNRHLASKIIAMQDAARTHDNVQAEISQIAFKSSSSLIIAVDANSDGAGAVKIKRQSVSFVVDPKPNTKTNDVKDDDKDQENGVPEETASTSTYPPVEAKNLDVQCSSTDTNGRYLMSGHARTHSIIINLDDKSRFTDEITV
ncbi:hypothetical protein NQ317_008966, partial [Molorchus minor]